MSCDCKHVCLEDLEDYLRKDSYFSDFTDKEKALVKSNLGLESYSGNYIEIVSGTYDDIYKLVSNEKLVVGNYYLITDFRSIYKCSKQVFGYDFTEPSKEYQILTTAISSSKLNPTVILLSKNSEKSYLWEVKYDITPVEVLDGIYNKGTITYMKDEYGNSAYYDFKNIKFNYLNSVQSSAKNNLSKTIPNYIYTFSDSSYKESSSQGLVENVSISKDSEQVFFFNKAKNVAISGNNIYIFGTCTNCSFDWGSEFLMLTSNISNYHGILGLLGENFLDIPDDVMKLCQYDNQGVIVNANNLFKTLDKQSSYNYIQYLDKETQTMQTLNI